MRKRIFALTLVLALVAAFAIPALGLTEAQIGTATPGDADNNHLYAVSTTDKYYAFQKTADLGNTKKLSWKEIKDTDKTLDGKLDLSKVVKDDGVLVFGPDKTTATNSSMLTATFTSIEVKKPATKPGKVETKGEKASYTSLVVTLTVDKGTEYAPVNGQGWEAADADGKIIIPLSANKQDFWLRMASSATAGPSPVVKFSVPAMPAGPSAKLDLSKNSISAKKDTLWYATDMSGSEIFGAEAAPKAVPSDGKDIDLSTITGADPVDGYIVYLATPGDKAKGRPQSAWTPVIVMAAMMDAPSSDNFVLAAKGQILVTGDVIIEMRSATDATAKWKKVKKLTKTDLVDTGVFRVAGSESVLPSESVKGTLLRPTGFPVS